MAVGRNKPGIRTSAQPRRRDRTIQESRHDIYEPKGKPKDPTQCPACRAVFREGRWSWDGAPTEAHQALCPACRRIQGRNPAGYLKLRGPALALQRDEILALVRHEAARAGKEHPLSRIIAVEEGKKEIVVSTTDTHLPQRLGEALRHAHHGELTLRYSKDQQLVRAWWSR